MPIKLTGDVLKNQLLELDLSARPQPAKTDLIATNRVALISLAVALTNAAYVLWTLPVDQSHRTLLAMLLLMSVLAMIVVLPAFNNVTEGASARWVGFSVALFMVCSGIGFFSLRQAVLPWFDVLGLGFAWVLLMVACGLAVFNQKYFPANRPQ
jgi:hypothetical protein